MSFMNDEQAVAAEREGSLADLLTAIRTKEDPDAFDVLSRRYSNLLDSMVRQFAPALGIDEQSKVSEVLGIGYEELRQDAAMVLYRAACTYIPDEGGKGGDVSFGLYAKICIRNAMISLLRRYNRQKKHREIRNTQASHNRFAVEADVLAEEILVNNERVGFSTYGIQRKDKRRDYKKRTKYTS